MPGTKIQPAWQTYADELVMLGHGIALWYAFSLNFASFFANNTCKQPAPLHNYKRVNIGDVGYIRQGRFHLLFSAALPLGERQLGLDVPQNFVSMSPGPTVNDQPRLPGALHTRYVEQKGAGFSASSDITCIDFGTTLQFESSSNKGAILLTKYRTYCEDAERLGFFKEYMLRHQRSWLDHANRLGHMVNLEDLVLITGHDMKLDFAMLAFSSNYRHNGIEFEAGIPAVASTSASVWGKWRTSTSVHHNCGPQHPLPIHDDARSIGSIQSLEDPLSEYNQCVFLRGFRIRRRAGLVPTVIKAAAGPHVLGSGPRDSAKEFPVLSRENGEKNEADVDIISDTPSFVDPLEPIFRYIFGNSTADVAIVNDSALARLFKFTGMSRGGNMKTLISQLHPQMIETSQEGIACIKETLSQSYYNTTKPASGISEGVTPYHNNRSSKEFLDNGERGIKREERLPSIHHMVADLYERRYSPYDFQDAWLPRVTNGTYSHHSTHAQHSYSRENSSGADSPPATFRGSSFVHRSQHRYHSTPSPPLKTRRRRSFTNDELSDDGDQDENGVGMGSQSTSGGTSSMAESLANSRKEAMSRQRIEAELRRRDELREGYAKLKDVLPPSKQKSSKVSLLERATNHIASLDQSSEMIHAQLAALEAEAMRLREVNERLSLTVAHDTGHMPTDAELGLPPPEHFKLGEGPALERRLSPPPDFASQMIL